MEFRDYIGKKVSFDENGAGYLWAEDAEGSTQMLAEIRGWGAIQNLFINGDGSIDIAAAENFQDGLGKWIAEAINEKMDRERNTDVVNQLPKRFREGIIGIVGNENTAVISSIAARLASTRPDLTLDVINPAEAQSQSLSQIAAQTPPLTISRMVDSMPIIKQPKTRSQRRADARKKKA